MHKSQLEFRNSISITSGVEAYEEAVDLFSENRWRFILFNLKWLFWVICGWLLVKIMFLGLRATITTWLLTTILYYIIVFPVWEIANIVKFCHKRILTPALIPHIVIDSFLYFIILLIAYMLFILPGIYLHTRLMLRTVFLASGVSEGLFSGLRGSWQITSGQAINMYGLWIIAVVSKPIASLPLGIAFVLERPLSGIAKNIMWKKIVDSKY